MNEYKIEQCHYDGRDITDWELVGRFTEDEAARFAAKLVELGYEYSETSGSPCGEYGVGLPEPVYDHHGNHGHYYCISRIITELDTSIDQAIEEILDPRRWDVYDDDEEDCEEEGGDE